MSAAVAKEEERLGLGHVLLVAFVLAALTTACYWPALGGDFVDYDDGAYVTKNPDVAAGLTRDGVRWAFTSAHSSNWHPLTWLSHMLDVELFGLEPRGHHATAVLLHALNAGLCLVAFFGLTGRLGPSLVVAALFALHPLRVESVAWVAERKDVLSGSFFFGVLIAYARHVRRGDTGKRGAMRWVQVLLVLGLLAKQMLVTLPFLLLVLDAGPLRRWRRGTQEEPGNTRALLREKVPLFLLCLGAGLATLAAQEAGGAIRTFESIPIEVRLSNAVLAYGTYLVQAVQPTDLAVFYPHPWLVAPEGFALFGPRVLLSGAGLLLVTALAWTLRRARPWLLAGWLWYLGTLLPVIGILQVGAQWMADRYAYLPQVGLYAALVFPLDASLRSHRARAALSTVGVALALACIPATRAQIRVWESTRTLFEHALAVTDRNYVALINLGFYEHNRGELDSAEERYRAALEIAPRMVDAHTNLGGLLLARGEVAPAEESLLLALELDPGFGNAWMLLGLLRSEQGDEAAALQAYRQAVEADPTSVEAELRLAIAEGLALAAAGDAAGACAAFERALRRRGRAEADEARVELVWLLATTADANVRDGVRAADLARELDRSGWRAKRALAAAFAAVGQFDLAAGSVLEAAAEAPDGEYRDLMDLHARFQRREALRL